MRAAGRNPDAADKRRRRAQAERVKQKMRLRWELAPAIRTRWATRRPVRRRYGGRIRNVPSRTPDSPAVCSRAYFSSLIAAFTFAMRSGVASRIPCCFACSMAFFKTSCSSFPRTTWLHPDDGSTFAHSMIFGMTGTPLLDLGVEIQELLYSYAASVVIFVTSG